MQVFFHKRFEKQFAKLPLRIQIKFKEQLLSFYENPFDPGLRNHPLQGKFIGHNSIHVTPDVRAIYRSENEETYLFTTIGSHSELYS